MTDAKRLPEAPAGVEETPVDLPQTCQICGATHWPDEPILCRICGEPVLVWGWAP
ncbi:MAG: hypothetical protein HY727_04080 [Candidatus Rokubacteria bacterium]|nr:hypothetical protein [Candidatus Rokubacteria bacterium]